MMPTGVYPPRPIDANVGSAAATRSVTSGALMTGLDVSIMVLDAFSPTAALVALVGKSLMLLTDVLLRKGLSKRTQENVKVFRNTVHSICHFTSLAIFGVQFSDVNHAYCWLLCDNFEQ